MQKYDPRKVFETFAKSRGYSYQKIIKLSAEQKDLISLICEYLTDTYANDSQGRILRQKTEVIVEDLEAIFLGDDPLDNKN